MNPGSSQFELGTTAFVDVLGSVACLQLHIDEMRIFGRDIFDREPSLVEVLEWFADRCTVVVTLDRLGAVGRLRGSDNLVVTRPFEVDAVDPTGAGDAFAAGVVASMLDQPLDSDAALERAMDCGGLFAAHACLTHGGAEGCPTHADLETFRASNSRALDTEITTIEQAGRTLTLLDQAFVSR